VTTGKQDETKGTDAMPVGVASTDQLGPLQPAAWMEPGKHWTLEHEQWMAHHRKDSHPNVQATLAAKTERLYSLTDEEVAVVNKFRARREWMRRDTARCKCDHNEYCQHCWPASFRPGGMWHGLGA